MKKTFASLILLSFCLAACSPVDLFPQVQVEEGIVYGYGRIAASSAAGRKALRLDLYKIPDSACLLCSRPGLLLMHGGGFQRGGRDNKYIVQLARALAAQGYIVASMSYRLRGDDPLLSPHFEALSKKMTPAAWTRDNNGASDPQLRRAIFAAAEDALQAVQWMHAHADQHGIDIERLGIGGASAGAITALNVAYVFADKITPPLKLVIDFWGARISDESPFIKKGAPALFIVHGSEDNTVPFSASLDLYQQARRAGVPVEYHPLKGFRHGFKNIDIMSIKIRPGITIFDRLAAFLSAMMKPPPPPPLPRAVSRCQGVGDLCPQ